MAGIRSGPPTTSSIDLKALQEQAVDEAEAEVSRIRWRMGESLLNHMESEIGGLVLQLLSLQQRVGRIPSEVTLGSIQLEQIQQEREIRTARKRQQEES